MIETKLIYLLQEQADHNTDKITLLESYIRLRLDKSFNTYEQEVAQSLKYLSQRKEIPLMKRLVKKL